MHKFWIVLIGAFSAAGFGLLPVSAERLDAPKTVQIVGSERFSPDEFFEITYRFATRRISVHKGDTVIWNNQTNDGHTVSIVSPGQVPKTVDQVNNCDVCNQLSAAHFPNGFPPQGTPVVFLDDLKPGSLPAKLDSVGDSLLIAPPGVGFPTSVSAQVTAPVGQTLNYICAFHAWMQGSIRVIADDQDAGDR
jgi:plastocyanin